jgi:hypothetical protein
MSADSLLKELGTERFPRSLTGALSLPD